MGFQKGNPGRPVGAKNKFKISTVKEFFREKEIDPIAEMFELYKQLSDPVAKLSFWLKIYPWIEIRSQKIENIGERSSGEPTGLEKKADGHLLEILHPEQKLNGTNGNSATSG